jgi:hypothetical protein
LKDCGIFIREKKIECGENYRIVEIFPYSAAQEKGSKVNGRVRVAESCPAQRNLNNRRASMHLEQLIFANMYAGDYSLGLSYAPEFVPATEEAAGTEFINFIRRVRYREKKKGLSACKYIHIFEASDGNGSPVRFHHHILLKSGLARDEIEALWSKNGKMIGFANCDRIQEDGGDGIISLAKYLTKTGGLTPPEDEAAAALQAEKPRRGRRPNKRRFSGSLGLTKPVSTKNDSRYTKRKAEALAKHPPEREYWERQYPGFRPLAEPNGFESVYNDLTGFWSIRLRLKRLPEAKKRKAVNFNE